MKAAEKLELALLGARVSLVRKVAHCSDDDFTNLCMLGEDISSWT